MDFNEWIEKKFIEWRGDHRDRSQTSFAAMIGVTQSVMSSWMRMGGAVPTSKKYVDKLAAVYGDEAYEALGLSKGDRLAAAFPTMPEGRRNRLADALEMFENAVSSLPDDDPRVTEALVEALKKQGFKVEKQ
jgi:hypothetical protein